MNNQSFTQSAHQAHLNDHKLMAARCQSCGALFLPPRPMCPDCHGQTMEWVALSGRGKLAAFTAVFIGPTAMIEAGYDRAKPYCTGIVQLDEGPAISAQILGVPADQPERIAIGTPLTVHFIERGEGDEKRTYLAFEKLGNSVQ